MKKLLTALFVVAMAFATMHAEAAKRLGGGKSMGQQSSNVTQREAAKPAPAATPNAAPAAAPAARINMSVGHASVQQVDHSAAQPSALAVHQAGRALSLLQRLLLLKVLIQHH